LDSQQDRELAVARIEGGGSAFAISPELVLTARHAVRSEPGADAAEVRLQFADARWMTATLERQDEAADIAILRLRSHGLPAGLEPLAVSAAVRYRQEWRAHGYPEAMSDRLTIHGSVTDPNAPLGGSASAMQLACWEAAAASPLPLSGFSGSPVIDEESGAAIGVVRLEFRNPESPGAVGGAIWATSLRYAAELWPDLIGELVQRRRRQLRSGLDGLLLHGLTADGELPLVSDMEAHAVGATPTRFSREQRAPYVRRLEVDAQLAGLLTTTTAVLIAGPSGAGKSRTAFEAARTGCPTAWFAQPRTSGQAVRKLMQMDRESAVCAGPLLLWLDELDEYLDDEESISPALLEWVRQRSGGGIIVATIREDQLTERHAARSATSKGVRLFLDQIESGTFYLRHQITPAEAESAARLYPGQDFSDLRLGIGQKLLAGPELTVRLSGAKHNSPHGWNVVKAAVDYVWMGLRPPIPRPVLQQLFEISVRSEAPHLSRDDQAFREALTWATEPVTSGVALLSASGTDRRRRADGFELADQAEEFGRQRQWRVPDESWQVAIAVSSADDLIAVSVAAAGQDLPEVEVAALRKAAASGSTLAVLELGIALAAAGSGQEGRQWIQQAVDASVPGAFVAMGAVLAEAGDLDGATDWLWRGLVVADADAAFLLGQLAGGQGRAAEAAYWLRIAALEGEDAAWLPLAWAEQEQGNAEMATACLKRGVEAGGLTAALCQHQLAIEAGDQATADRWLQAAAGLGDANSARMLGQLRAEEGRIPEALSWLAKAAQTDPLASYDLGVLYESAGDTAAAQTQYERAYEKGGTAAAALARICLAAGDVSGAESWLRAEADSAVPHPEACWPVAVDLAEVLRRRGRGTAAREWLQRGAEAGYVPAMARLGEIAMADDDAETAERWLLEAARARYPAAAGRLGEVLASTGALSRAVRWLRIAAEDERDTGEPGGSASAAALARAEERLAAEREHQPDPAAGAAELADGLAAQQRGDAQAARSRFAIAAASGSAPAAYQYGLALRSEGDELRAAHYLRMAAERGHAGAAAALLPLAADPLEWQHWLEVAVSAGDPTVIAALAQHRLANNEPAEAEALLRQLATRGDLMAAGALGALLQDRGAEAEARDWLTRALAADGEVATVAAYNLGAQALRTGDAVQARSWLGQAAGARNPAAMVALARLLLADGDREQAETLLRQAFERGDAQAAAELSLVRNDQGDSAGALQWAVAAAERGHVGSAFVAGRLSYDAGHIEDAERWLGVAAGAGVSEAAVRLAALLARRGDARAAELMLAGPVSKGDGLALYAAGDLASRRGWMSAAESYFVSAVEAGHLFAALDAANLADLRGDAEMKAHWLQVWQAGGTNSAIALQRVRDFDRVGVVVIHYSPWEPGQPVTYSLSTPAIQLWINGESGLDLPFK
jgi:hypothetical protein